MPLRPPRCVARDSKSCGCSTCSRPSSQLLAMSPLLHARLVLCRRRLVRTQSRWLAFGCHIGLFVAYRSWLLAQFSVLGSAWWSWASDAVPLAVFVACWSPFATRSSHVALSGASALGRSSASVALELRSTTSRRAAAADRLCSPRCVAPRRRHGAVDTLCSGKASYVASRLPLPLQ